MANQQYELFIAALNSTGQQPLGEDSAPQPVVKLKPNISQAWLRGVRRRLQDAFQYLGAIDDPEAQPAQQPASTGKKRKAEMALRT